LLGLRLPFLLRWTFGLFSIIQFERNSVYLFGQCLQQQQAQSGITLRRNVSPCGSPFRRNGGRITFGVALVVEPPASRHFVQHRIYEILRFENFVFSLELRKFALRYSQWYDNHSVKYKTQN
jgi:hypothetical protein